MGVKIRGYRHKVRMYNQERVNKRVQALSTHTRRIYYQCDNEEIRLDEFKPFIVGLARTLNRPIPIIWGYSRLSICHTLGSPDKTTEVIIQFKNRPRINTRLIHNTWNDIFFQLPSTTDNLAGWHCIYDLPRYSKRTVKIILNNAINRVNL